MGRVVKRELADPTDRESVSLGGASPLSPTIFLELKPQQTGTRLLIGYGEVATMLIRLVDKIGFRPAVPCLLVLQQHAGL